jgi:serine/threonine-protein kinase
MNDSLDALPGRRALDEGTVFAGRFRVVRALGQGGMGSVYEAVQVTLDRPVALKLLHPALTMDLSLVQRFQREARLMAALRHPNIVEVIDAGVEDGALWIAMEYLRGETLAHWLESLDHPPSPAEMLPRVTPIARALAHMHAREIVHRDVKPDNVMLARDERGEVVPKLLDLGIAHPRVEGAKLTATGALLGTPAYIAPEQAWGVADISPAADQWSFAAMLYEAFTGHLPHESDTPMGIITRRVAGPADRPETLLADFDPALADVLMRALEPAPEDRYPSLDALLDALAPFADLPSAVTSLSAPLPSLAPPEPRAPTHIAPRPTPEALAVPALPLPPALPSPDRRAPIPSSAPVAIAPPSSLARGWPVVLAALIATGALALALRPSAPAPSPTRDAAPAPPPTRDVAPDAVTFTLDFSPATARISLDDSVIGAGHASLRVPRDGRSYALRAEAPGFVPFRDVLRASGDAQISRTLEALDGGSPARVTAPSRRPPPPPAGTPAATPRATSPTAPTLVPHRRPIDPTYPE